MEYSLDAFFNKETKWQLCYETLRELALKTQLNEELKWGKPCYTLKGANVFLMHGFKDYCALLFHKGALLKDPHGALIQQTANVQAARQLRFKTLSEIEEQSEMISAYMQEAIEIEKAGLAVKMKETSAFEMAEEFKMTLSENPDLKKAFEALTPGRQRGYLLHFSQPKQSKTRLARVQKAIPMIMAKKGLNDRP